MLTERQQQVAELDRQGLTQVEIAKRLGITQQKVSRVKTSRTYLRNVHPDKFYENEIQAQTTQIIREEVKKRVNPVIDIAVKASPMAMKTLVKLARKAESEDVKRGASNDLLGYAGHLPEKKFTTQSIELTGEDAENIAVAFKYQQTRVRGTADSTNSGQA